MADTTLIAALVTALSDMPNPVKNSDNPAFKRDGRPMRYADLEATLDACKPILAACGIAVMQHPVSGPGGVGVHTWLIGHGETMDCGEFVLPLAKQDPQGAGSAITYARRYALVSLFGLAQEDDDANVASGHTTTQAATTQAAATTESKPDAVEVAFDALMKLAELSGKKDAVGKELGSPKTRAAGLTAYRALSAAKRKALEVTAGVQEA